jgi:hypothetical protein
MTAETEIRAVLSKIDSAWRNKNFDGLDRCFHPRAVIVGPDYAEYASGRDKCAESYKEFAVNADVLEYSEEGHRLHIWESSAVYTFRWSMTYRRDAGPRREHGSDQLVLQLEAGQWQVVWRYIFFSPSGPAS